MDHLGKLVSGSMMIVHNRKTSPKGVSSLPINQIGSIPILLGGRVFVLWCKVFLFGTAAELLCLWGGS